MLGFDSPCELVNNYDAVMVGQVQLAAMPRDENTLGKIREFVINLGSHEESVIREKFSVGWPVVEMFHSGAITITGVTIFGWDMVEELDEYLHLHWGSQWVEFSNGE